MMLHIPNVLTAEQVARCRELFAQARGQVPAWETITVRLGGGPPPNALQGSRAQGPQALTFAIREQGAWPLFAAAQVSLNPFTGQVLRRETFADYNLGRKVRSWMRQCAGPALRRGGP
jgi:hypothetical protein